MVFDKVLCPWCGAEMLIKYALKGKEALAWTECTNERCAAEGPLVECCAIVNEAKAAARAAALRRYTPPIKPMTLEEIKQVRYEETAFWIEFESSYKAEPACHWYLWSGLRGYSAHVVGYCEPWHLPVCDYGRTWRCWERRPTDEERNAAEWET